MNELPRLLVAAVSIAYFAAAPIAFTQELMCEDIEFDSSVTQEFPSVAQTCHSVVQRDDGKLYVRLVADVVRVKNDGSMVLDLKARDGSKVRQEFNPPSGFRAIISGKPEPSSELRRGQEIRLYLPATRWRVRPASNEP